MVGDSRRPYYRMVGGTIQAMLQLVENDRRPTARLDFAFAADDGIMEWRNDGMVERWSCGWAGGDEKLF